MAELSAPVFRDKTDNFDIGGAATSLAFTNPAGLADGDGQILWFGALTVAGGSPVLTTPSGWLLVGSQSFTGWAGGIDGTVAAFKRIAASDGTATVTCDRASYVSGVRLAYSNADPTTWDSGISVVFGATASGTTHTLPGITTTKDGQMSSWYIVGSAASTWTPPGTVTEREDLGGSGSVFAGDAAEATAGATGTRAFTSSATTETRYGIAVFQGLPIITAQPAEQTAADGATATFSVTAPTATGYQWQRQDPLGGSWANVSGGSGATTASYTTPTLARGTDAGALYRCVVTAPAGTVNSTPALLKVTQIPTSYASSAGLVVGSSLSFVGQSYVGATDSSVQSGATGTATETDAALQLGVARPAGLATETDTALALAGVQLRAAGLSTETDASLALAAVQISGTGLASETDAALSLGSARPAGRADETDASLALAWAWLLALRPVPRRWAAPHRAWSACAAARTFSPAWLTPRPTWCAPSPRRGRVRSRACGEAAATRPLWRAWTSAMWSTA